MRGGVDWTPQRLAWTSILAAWDDGQTLRARFEHACDAAGTMHPHWRLGASYSGFTAALNRHYTQLVPALGRRFRRQMPAVAGSRWLLRGWCVLAADGTRLETPHTAANEAILGCAGREKSAPQVYLTSLWHLASGLPWDFRTGPGTDSERRHLEQMLDELPARALIVADAGFCGYELCQRILAAGASFLLRVGSNVSLLTELGWHVEQRDGLVYLWPEDFRKSPPLVLRLIEVRSGNQTIYLVTNVLDPAQLSDEDAAQFYAMRWGIEVGYRTYKQTLDRRKLLSRTPEACLAEAQWTMIAVWLLGLLCVSQHPVGGDRRGWSPAMARDSVRRAMRHPLRREHRRTLHRELQAARLDRYQRLGSKTARNYPRKKREKPPGPPKIRTATAHQVRLAAALRAKLRPAA